MILTFDYGDVNLIYTELEAFAKQHGLNTKPEGVALVEKMRKTAHESPVIVRSPGVIVMPSLSVPRTVDLTPWEYTVLRDVLQRWYDEYHSTIGRHGMTIVIEEYLAYLDSFCLAVAVEGSLEQAYEPSSS